MHLVVHGDFHVGNVFQDRNDLWLHDFRAYYGTFHSDLFNIIESGELSDAAKEKVLEEVRNGIISVEKSKNDYGIAIDPDTFKINYKITNKLRGRIK